MSNLYFGKVVSREKYTDLSTLIGEEFDTETTYMIQCQGVATICESPTEPTEGGFVLFNNEIARWKPTDGKLWIKTFGAVVYVNIAK